MRRTQVHSEHLMAEGGALGILQLSPAVCNRGCTVPAFPLWL